MTKRIDPTQNLRGKTGNSRKLLAAVHAKHKNPGRRRKSHGWGMFRDGV